MLATISSKLELRKVKNFIPENVMSVTESVGQIMVKDLCKNQVYEEVIICELFTPSYFFCQLRKNSKPFKEFMIKLHSFYEENKSKYQIPSILLKQGLNVACRFGNQWHRAIIETVKPEEQVRVHFYDYGTVKSYRANEMFFLHKSFTNLPAQAILCGLHNVMPIGKNEWEKGIWHEFIQKSKGPLRAIISSLNTQENSALIRLTNTSGKENLHLNDWLCAKNFATVGRHTQKNNRNFTFLHYKKSLQHKGYDTSNITKNTDEPLLNGSFNFSGSEISTKENESIHKTKEKNSRSVEITLKHNYHQEQGNRNIEKIHSLLSFNHSPPQSLKLKNPTFQSKFQVQENNKSEGQISCPKILQRTLALISKNQKKKEGENNLSLLTSVEESFVTVETIEFSKSTVTNNSSITCKPESRREMLLRFVKSSPSTDSKSKDTSCQNRKNSSEKKIVNENCKTNVKNSSDVEKLLENEIASKALHFKQVQEEKVSEFGITIAKDVPKFLNITQQECPLIQPELANVKSSTTPISYLLKLKQRLYDNSF